MVGVEELDFAKQDGLVPCITQDARTGRVLMLAYLDEEALEATLSTGEMHYHSRSRDELWHKGETSGNTQQLVRLSADCDADTLLALVHPTGPACHTGEVSCFFDDLQAPDTETDAAPILAELQQVVADRAETQPEGSWTTRLLTEEGLAEAKLAEEADEVLASARGEDEDPLAHELADLFYHALVLANKHDVELGHILAELEDRRS
jgi:phosphoribosyl-ATP pyrophosphohydrolase/phosphoribosyl-AMP cyclohydrolase